MAAFSIRNFPERDFGGVRRHPLPGHRVYHSQYTTVFLVFRELFDLFSAILVKQLLKFSTIVTIQL